MAKLEMRIPDWLDKIATWPVMWYRRRKYGYDFRKIDLGDGQFTTLDKKDYYELCNYKWYLSGNGKKFYAIRNEKVGPGKIKMVSMHRQITNAPKGRLVDHKNTNSLDNRSSNLRLATHSQNSYNRQKTKIETSSRFIGVYEEKRTGKWPAKIKYEGKYKYLGRFRSEIEAARAYDAAAKKYHGEFARLNFPEQQDC